VDQIIPAKIEAPVDEVYSTPMEEQVIITTLADQELEPDNERNRAYYEDQLDNTPYNSPFDFSTLNPSFHLTLTGDL
jgi:hypothetical protein